ncbi:nuclease SbcCD subunit C-like [Dreissena polymorpha]|uniref:nuclease SbcCD subunit C-like n=1 Tax=Dreissena polymorpha TaxID=45954 RepID=UPI002264C3AC|nr:nuclease SbcCD subunit C-like [Dreissena polymorpha]XP_052266846.1 nuclease SbcCD subunit C-like [Dreissena polymorpha]
MAELCIPSDDAVMDIGVSRPSKLATIKHVLSLHSSLGSSDTACAKKLIDEFPSYCNCDFQSLKKKIGLVAKKSAMLKRNKTKTSLLHEEFLQQEFVPPVSKLESSLKVDELNNDQGEIAQKVIATTQSVVRENRDLKRKISEIEESRAELENEIKFKDNRLQLAFNSLNSIATGYKELTDTSVKSKAEMEKHILEYQNKYEEATAQILKLTDDLSVAREKISKYTPRNVNKKLKRKASQIESLASQNELLAKENKGLKIENESLWGHILIHEDTLMEEEENEKVKGLKFEKVNLQKRISRLGKKIESLKTEKHQIRMEKETIENNFDTEIADYKKEIKELQQIIDISDSNEVVTFENGKYTNEIRQCCMQLIHEGNVSLNKVPDVISSVMRALTGKVPQRLPSKTLLSWLSAEAKVVSSRHVAQAMLDGFNPADNKGHTLHQDATSKFHNHYEG